MKMKRKLVKVAIERTDRTDLICVSCGNFRTEWALLPVATETLANGKYEPQAGVHTMCIAILHARNVRKKKGNDEE